MQISYAQRLEDYHLDSVLGAGKFQVYVDIGGGHPVADNVSFHFYLKGWHGLIVEPQQKLAEAYRSLRPRDVVIHHLAGAHEDVATFHRVDKFHGFSTVNPGNAEMAAGYGVDVIQEAIRVEPLSAMLERAGFQGIDFLKIDVEGAERDVLLGIDFMKHRPRCICVEAVAPGTMEAAWMDWEPLLLADNYVFVFFDGLNRFYVDVEEPELAARFPSAPVDWGTVTHLYEFGQAGSADHHPDKLLAGTLIAGFLARLPTLSESEISALLKAGSREISQTLLDGTAHFPGSARSETPSDGLVFDDRVRAALGRIASGYDGGMIFDDT